MRGQSVHPGIGGDSLVASKVAPFEIAAQHGFRRESSWVTVSDDSSSTGDCHPRREQVVSSLWPAFERSRVGVFRRQYTRARLVDVGLRCSFVAHEVDWDQPERDCRRRSARRRGRTGSRETACVGGGADPGFYVIDFDATVITSHRIPTRAVQPRRASGDFGSHPLQSARSAGFHADFGCDHPRLGL